jgi:hypothetical protein
VPARPSKSWYDRQHDRFYEAYWRHIGRQDSRRAHEKCIGVLVKSGMTLKQAADFLPNQAVLDRQRFADSPDWEWRQNLHPATWLNGQRWRDEARARGPSVGARKSKGQEFEEMMERI